jgi:hypothetical protein
MTETRECFVASFEEDLDPLSKSITFTLWTSALRTKPRYTRASDAFEALDLLGSVVSALFSSDACAVDRLALHHACARLGIALVAHPHTTAQSGVYLFPDTVYPPGRKVVVNRLPGREVVG